MLVIGTPLACGAIHRPSFQATLAVTAVLTVAAGWLGSRSRSRLTLAAALALPLFFLLVAAVQLTPLPAGLRALLDGKGSALLALAGLKGAQPLSLDPPATYAELAKAAAAVGVTLAALVLSSGRRLRFFASGAVACAGLATLAVGLGHRAANASSVWGLVPAVGGLPVGPFVNPNHTAELLELSAFAALAFAFSRTTRDGQRVWKVLAAVLAAGAIATLSRGSVLALGSGVFAWFLLAPRSDEGEPLHRSRFVAALLALLVVVGLTIGFGGDRIIDEFHGSVGDNLSKLAVAKDALSVFSAHPAGIGLGAFGRVYPIYQTLPVDWWFEYVENQPVSLLVETGVAGALCLLGLLALSGRRFWKDARRDRAEASLVAGLVAVVAHNLVDFGLEMPGVLLPFCALWGAAFGRQAMQEATRVSLKPALTAGLACVATIAGLLLMRTPATRDFDALMRPPLTPTSQALAHEASLAHPTDYAYALAAARLEPEGRNGTNTQTRLRLLNRAMLLCPRCAGAHQEAARALWRLGRRTQALLEWKMVIARSRGSLSGVLAELHAGGATAPELATLADKDTRYDVCRYLLSLGQIALAKATLDQDDGPENVTQVLARAEIALAAKDTPSARKASQRALDLAPRDPNAVLMAANIALLDPNGSDEAVAILEKGLRSAPGNVELNRKVLSILMTTDKWQAIDRALAGFRSALAEAGAPATDANLAAASIFERRGQYRRAMSEYQAALSHAPGNIGILLALARAAEQIGGITSAVDAYNAVLRHDPANQEARSALARIQFDKKALEVDSILRANPGAEAK